MPRPLRLVVYDATDTGDDHAGVARGDGEADGRARAGRGLSPIWKAGTLLHALTRAADGSLGARSWSEALRWAADLARRQGRPIGSLQAWGHGDWGGMWMGSSHLDRLALEGGSELAAPIDGLRDALAGPESLVWLRCCSAFGHARGRAFARALADRLGCRVAGHTFVIGLLQSGTHSLGPGEVPSWDAREGIRSDGERVAGALASSPGAPNTITCFRLGLPRGM